MHVRSLLYYTVLQDKVFLYVAKRRILFNGWILRPPATHPSKDRSVGKTRLVGTILHENFWYSTYVCRSEGRVVTSFDGDVCINDY